MVCRSQPTSKRQAQFVVLPLASQAAAKRLSGRFTRGRHDGRVVVRRSLGEAEDRIFKYIPGKFGKALVKLRKIICSAACL